MLCTLFTCNRKSIYGRYFQLFRKSFWFSNQHRSYLSVCICIKPNLDQGSEHGQIQISDFNEGAEGQYLRRIIASCVVHSRRNNKLLTRIYLRSFTWIGSSLIWQFNNDWMNDIKRLWRCWLWYYALPIYNSNNTIIITYNIYIL